ncbi:MAG TPA: phosphoribosylglycinamide formyltransferase [Clostridiales bacterium]|jgi:phosphoribosylglycinamide formyltransferase-1|nr:phosphoribosylglycinamide formyltransferase [Clostridiales bacterium]HRT82069.1 phosphoribosylglycinamide formyltransferase [Oscillospiraceae bacterium]
MLGNKKKVKIAVLVSGGGSNLQALIDAQNNGIITDGSIVRVISSKSGVYALERAQKADIETTVIDRAAFPSSEEFNKQLISALLECGAELVILAGFLSVLEKFVTDSFKNRIINVHPSLIPSFCGPGYYGLKVHEEALKRGVKVTGATVHIVNEITDGGPILLQKCVEVMQNDTAETLQKRVMEEAEWILLPRAAQIMCEKILNENI